MQPTSVPVLNINYEWKFRMCRDRQNQFLDFVWFFKKRIEKRKNEFLQTLLWIHLQARQLGRVELWKILRTQGGSFSDNGVKRIYPKWNRVEIIFSCEKTFAVPEKLAEYQKTADERIPFCVSYQRKVWKNIFRFFAKGSENI